MDSIKELFENSPFGLLIKKKNGKLIYINKFGFDNELDNLKFSTKDKEIFNNGKWYKVISENQTINKEKVLFSILVDVTDLKSDFDESDSHPLKIVEGKDKLTNLSSKEKLKDAIFSEVAKSERYNRIFSITILDVDNLSDINGQFGKKNGDIFLIEFANFLQDNTRTVDILGRWEGNSLLFISPETDINGAINMAEKLKNQIENKVFNNIGHITASFGVAGYLQGDTVDSMVKRVFRGLKTAKTNGKNRVEFELI